MERLNDIIARSAQRRQQSAEPRPTQNTAPAYGPRPQGQRPMPANQPPLRRPTRQLPEQMAHLGQNNAFRAQAGQSSPHTQQAPTTRMRPTQENSPQYNQPQVAPHLSQAPTRPVYPRQRPAQSTVPFNRTQERESTPTRPFYEIREQAEQLRPRNNYQHNNDYMAPLHSDVQEDDEEGEAGMQYGYWEGDDNDDQSTYAQAEAPIYTPAPKAPTVRETYVAPEVERRSYTTRNLQEPPRTAQPLPPPMPMTRVQEVPNYSRRTQPLNPQMVAGLQQEHHAQQAPQQPTRQLVARDSLIPLPMPNVTEVSITKTICPKCKGAGYLRANVPFGHPNFGKPVACECKEAERREKRRQQLIELSDLNAFRQQSFHNFSTNFQGIHPSVVEAYEEARRFAQNPNGWLILIGPNGCGKTHLAAAIANQSLNEGDVVLFSVVPELLDHLRGAFAPSATEIYDQLFSKMREAGLLVLDDLGAHYGTPWASEKLYQLLNYRYSWRMPTVITTNNLGLQAVDARLRSRMMDNSLVVTVNLERARDCRPYLPRRDS